MQSTAKNLQTTITPDVCKCSGGICEWQSVSKTNDAGYQDAVGGVVRDDAGDASAARVLESSDGKRSGMGHLQAYSCVDASLREIEYR